MTDEATTWSVLPDSIAPFISFIVILFLFQAIKNNPLLNSQNIFHTECTMLKGSCLCGAVAFEITGQVTDIYQCHCSKCRKALGTSGVSVFLSSGADFRWVGDEESITLFTTPTGYRSVFCSKCGSHLPDPNPDKTTYWIPAGLLDEQHPPLRVGAHMYVESKASWDAIGDEGIQYSAGFPES